MALSEALKFGTFEKTRAVTAVVELGRNAIEHGNRGRARFSYGVLRGRPALEVSVLDHGTGIPQERLSGDTANRTVPGHGAGLGLGLRGVQRIAARFDVTTGQDGTRIDVAFTSSLASFDSKALIASASDALSRLNASDPEAVLTEQNRELMDSVAAHDLLMKELHHRTGNNLALIVALIRMSKVQAVADETRQILGELETRVGSLAKAHEVMQRATNAGSVPAQELLDDIARNTEKAFNTSGLRVVIKVNCPSLHLDGRVAVDIGLIVGELITNAYKHAFTGRSAGAIAVDLSDAPNGELFLSVQDDGVGLADKTARPERSNSLGWRLIRALTAQNHGTLTVDGLNGLAVHIRFAPSS
ncbi:hypothetical protein BV911_12945 [Pseudoruegeria sp. SK021]|nr:hypothetical protein BV911_12945 [Pseudoruegeria sp. SK021]